MNLKLASLQTTFLDLKSRTLDFQLTKISELASINFTSDSPKASSEVRLLIEQISNITLERQQLSNDKLAHKLHEMQFEIDKMKSKVEDNSAKYKVLTETSGKSERIFQTNVMDVKDVKKSSLLFESFMIFVGALVVLVLLFKLVFYFRNNFVVRTRMSKGPSENTLRTTFEQAMLWFIRSLRYKLFNQNYTTVFFNSLFYIHFCFTYGIENIYTILINIKS